MTGQATSEAGVRFRPTVAQIDLGAIRHNARVQREEQHRERAQRGHQADGEGRVGENQHEPGLGDILGPCP